MSCSTTILIGPARAGKTSQLLAAYRTAVAAEPPGSALWIGPNHGAVQSIRNALIGPMLRQCLQPNCLTFGKLSQAVLDAASSPLRPVDELMKRRLLGGILQRGIAAGQIVHFAGIADTPGLVRLVASTIRQWKRLEIWPHEFAAACMQTGLSQKHAELLWVYEEYQRLLGKHLLYDQEGRLWLARTRLREESFRPFETVRHVFVDGFTDFTRTQLETLLLFAERAESLHITLPGEGTITGEERRELFAKPAATLAELQCRLPGATVQWLDRRSTAHPGLDQLEANLFCPVASVEAVEHADITVVEAAGRRQELEGLARRIKTLLTRKEDPVRPEQVLVVLRSMSGGASQLQSIFERFGIPAAVEEPPVLGASACVSSLIAWLKLAVEDWPFRQLLATLSHNSLQPDWPEWRQGRASMAAEHVVRALQVPRGRQEVLSRIGRLAAQASAADEPWHHAQRLQRARLAAPLLAQIARATDALPQQATPRAWAVALTALANDVGIYKLEEKGTGTFCSQGTAKVEEKGTGTFCSQGTAKGASPLLRAAWDRLMEHLRSLDRLNQWMEAGDAQCSPHAPHEAPHAEREGYTLPHAEREDYTTISLPELLALIGDIAVSEPGPMGGNTTGCVRVVGAATARSLSAPYVFVAGLTEKSFPSFSGENALYGDAEISQLAGAGLPLPTQDERSRDEMLLFYEVLTRATRALVLSYPSLDDKAQPLPPSPYVSELLRTFKAGGVEIDREDSLSPVPLNQPILCEQDWRLRAVHDVLSKDPKLLAGIFQTQQSGPQLSCLPGTSADNLRSALRMLQSRTQSTFGPFEGLLGGDAVLQRLHERFGEDRPWSASQLEKYAYCPYQYFLSKLLRIEPPSDLALETDHMLRGSLIHGTLATLHRQLNRDAGGPTSPASLSAEKFEQQALEVLATLIESLTTADALAGGLLEVDRRILSQWLLNYYEQHLHYDELCREADVPFLPAHFEVAFGPEYASTDGEEGLHVAADTLRTAKPLELNVGEETIRISGRIDRVDLGEVAGQPVFHVIDYKSSTKVDFKPAMIATGERLQLPLYALALEQLLLAERGAIPWRASYWLVKEKGVRHKAHLDFHEVIDGRIEPTEAWQAARKQLLEIVAGLVRGIRGGQFPVYCADEKCTSRCEYRTVCRIGQVRAFDKVWQIGAATEETS